MYSLTDAIIIGITGRAGKTSVAYLTHEYLKSIGKKSILYSSTKVDSPCSKLIDNGMFFTFSDEKQIAQILKEAVAYEAEFIIIECWEQSIAEGVFDNIPFDLKVMTKLLSTSNGHIDGNTIYQNKLKFFKDEEDAKCLINIVGHWDPKDCGIEQFIQEANISNLVLYDTTRQSFFSKILYNEVPDLENYTNSFNTLQLYENIRKYISADMIKYSLGEYKEQINDLTLKILIEDECVELYSKLITGYNAENITSVIAILNEIKMLDLDAFKNFISDPLLEIPGRMEAIDWRNRTIIIDKQTRAALLFAKNLGNNKSIKAVTCYPIVDNVYIEPFLSRHPEYNKLPKEQLGWTQIPKAVNEFADYAYVTVGGLSSYSAEYLTDTLAQQLTVPYEKVLSREEAFKNALIDSDEGDIICIVGVGDDKFLVESYDNLVRHSERKLLDRVIDELEEIYLVEMTEETTEE